jgi:CheY-like chemotaxis protein
MRALIVEDDPDLRRQLADVLTHSGYAVDTAADGEDGLFLGETEPYDAIVLDLGLPKLDGVTVLERWREAGMSSPVLILTARDRWSEKVAGFDAGADDYLTKPFPSRRIAGAPARPDPPGGGTRHLHPDVRRSEPGHPRLAGLPGRSAHQADLARVPDAELSDASP